MEVTIDNVKRIPDYFYSPDGIDAIKLEYLIEFEVKIGFFTLKGEYKETAKVIDEMSISEIENHIKEHLIGEPDAKREGGTK